MFSEIKYSTKKRKTKKNTKIAKAKRATKKTHSLPLTKVMAVHKPRRKTKSDPLVKTRRKMVSEKEKVKLENKYSNKMQLRHAAGSITAVKVLRERPIRPYKLAKHDVNKTHLANNKMDTNRIIKVANNSPQVQLINPKHNNTDTTKETKGK